jgi:hypothetical protein
MSATENQCPSCKGTLKPAADRPGLLECASCKTLYAPQMQEQRSFMDVLAVVVVAIGKIILVLAGLVVVGIGVLFAGCLFSGFKFHD